MSTPLATPAELGVYLGQDIATGDARATLLLQCAHDRCEMYVSPVPALAKGIELAVAGRAYTNVSSAHQMSLGSASVSFGSVNSTLAVGGLYLSKSEIRDLRRAAGRLGAGSVSMVPSDPPTSAPAILSATPDAATTGALVRIVGAGFNGSTAVTFGGVAAQFLVVADDVVHAVMPSGSAGSAPVVVTNAIGSSDPLPYTRG